MKSVMARHGESTGGGLRARTAYEVQVQSNNYTALEIKVVSKQII